MNITGSIKTKRKKYENFTKLSAKMEKNNYIYFYISIRETHKTSHGIGNVVFENKTIFRINKFYFIYKNLHDLHISGYVQCYNVDCC